MADELRLWLWTIANEVTGRRMQTRYRMTEADARGLQPSASGTRFADHSASAERGSSQPRSSQR